MPVLAPRKALFAAAASAVIVLGSASPPASASHALRPAHRPAGVRTAASTCEPPLASEGCFGLTPADLRTAYGLPSKAPTEQRIAIVIANNDLNITKDVRVYDEEFGLPECTAKNKCLELFNGQGKTKPLPEATFEADLEMPVAVEVAHAICTNCRIAVVEASSDTLAALEEAEESAALLPGVTEISNGWGFPEPTTPPNAGAAFNHPGIAITAAAGDSGFNNLLSPVEEDRGHAQYPASSPDVVAVGGTELFVGPEGEWKNETVWEPERPLDESGGSACSKYFAAPSWQTSVKGWSNVGCVNNRAAADISAVASWSTGAAIYNSSKNAEGVVPKWEELGGTRVGASLVAAAFALAGGAHGVEYPAQTLYANVARDQEVVHDVTHGTNGTCGHVNPEECSREEDEASCSDGAICVAGTGYDGPSGLGSLNGIDALTPPHEQTVSFKSEPPSPALVGEEVPLEASASSELPVTFESTTTGVCEVTGTKAHLVAPGECSIEAIQPGNAEYAAATAKQTFTVFEPQHVNFQTLPPEPAYVGESYAAEATASSALTVSLATLTPTVCTVEEAAVKLRAEGECRLEASQAGNGEFAPASAIQAFSVSRRPQIVSFTPPGPVEILTGEQYAVEGADTASLPLLFSTQTPGTCSLVEGLGPFGEAVAMNTEGECRIEAAQAGDGEYEPASAVMHFIVSRRAQTISISPRGPAGKYVGEQVALESESTSGLAVLLSSATPKVCTIEGATVTLLEAGMCEIDANQEGDTLYKPAPQKVQDLSVVEHQTVTIESTPPAQATAGGTYKVEASASSGLPVTLLSLTPTVCELEGPAFSLLTGGTCTIAATQAGNERYGPAPEEQQSFTVLLEGQTIEFTSSAPAEGVAGATYEAAAKASSGLPVTFTSETPSVCTVTGPAVKLNSAGNCTITAHEAGDARYAPAESVGQTFTVHRAFSLTAGPRANSRSGVVHFGVRLPGAGVLRWQLQFRNGSFGVTVGGHVRCGHGTVRLHGACYRALIPFSTGSVAQQSEGTRTVVARPTRAALRALRRARKVRGTLKLSVLIEWSPGEGATVPLKRTLTVRPASR